ncbi:MULTISPECIES: hypothetical protein [Actinomadura]|uniref:DUF11 domain-containing protein n=1 Tax=Actinomadura yumaensis TaxID=111807 RepID=A0ABW2CX10_9ACTN|nr:hypothetical protein [Actinomadura sp. J1-007]MWK32613.1 hypothetical protein [Actinomadura sp. J1-007]
MSLANTWKFRIPLLAAAISVLLASVAATSVVLASAGPGERRAGGSATSTGVRLDVTPVPGLGRPGFNGSWGQASIGADTGQVNADYGEDPDGVGRYVTIAVPSGSVTGDTAGGSWRGVSDPNDVNVSLVPGGPPVLNVPTMHTFAQCQPPHAPITQNSVTAPTVAGRPIRQGVTTVPVTGERLGLRNAGGTALPDATFTDDLSDIARHAHIDGITASTGHAAYGFRPPKLTWTGSLKPGRTATVRITATARRPGVMRNAVGKDRTSTHVVPRHVK